MSGHVGLREEARSGARLAAQIAQLFACSRLAVRLAQPVSKDLLIARVAQRPRGALPDA